MLAARLHGREDLRVEDVDAPAGPLGATEALVDVAACGICGTDLHEYAAGPLIASSTPHPLTGASLPQILGHELSGTVVETGAEVSGLRPGDRVAVMPLVYCGRCAYCERGLQNLCEQIAFVGLTAPWGGFAERAVFDRRQLVPLPDGISDEQGALLEPAAVAVNAVESGGVRPGDTVLVVGAGPIGALTMMAARAAGAAVVIAAEVNERRMAIARELGADLGVDPRDAAVTEQLLEATGGAGADVAIDCAGADGALSLCIDATRKRGTVVICGNYLGPASIDPMTVSSRELRLVGMQAFATYGWDRIARLVASGSFPVERTITARVDLPNVVEAGFEPLLDAGSDQLKILVSKERKA